MAILQVNNLTKYYGSKEIFSNISFAINQRERVGLVGANGTGKSTLLKIIAQEEKEDDGEVFLSSGTTVGYLAQSKDFTLSTPLLDFLSEPLQKYYQCEKEMFNLTQEIPHLRGSDLQLALERLDQLQEWYALEEGYQANARLETIFNSLGFLETDKNRPISSFSGGERTRVELARRLLERPTLLILDEPTNHLDAVTIQWLESFLKTYPHSILVVSHDRYFLDEIVEKVLFLDSGKLQTYRGNYSQFREQLKEEEEALKKAYMKQQAYIKKEKDLIDNAKETEKAQRFAKSREKRLQQIEIVKRPRRQEQMHFQFPFSSRSGNIVVKAEELAFSYAAEKPLIRSTDFLINYGDKIALVGPNGSGKTTLLRLILGELKPNDGYVRLGASVDLRYFPQTRSFYSEANTVLQEVLDHKHMTLGEARDHLALFLFKDDAVFKQVKDLSGGEKSRLVLAKLALSEGNFFIFDEPTNHLDIDSLETLEEALLDFQGTVLFVSHDRYFVSKLAKKILHLEDGNLTYYPFGYQQYVRERDRERNISSQQNKEIDLHLKTNKMKRERPRKIVKKKEELLKYIGELEEEKEDIEVSFTKGEVAFDWEKLSKMQKRIKSIDDELITLYEDWLELEEGEE